LNGQRPQYPFAIDLRLGAKPPDEGIFLGELEVDVLGVFVEYAEVDLHASFSYLTRYLTRDGGI
jgi:hypothetical protein